MERLFRIIRDSLQQVANTCKLKSEENKLKFFPLVFPREKNNNEAWIRMFFRKASSPEEWVGVEQFP